MTRRRLLQILVAVLVLCTLCLASCGSHAPRSIPAVNELRSVDHSGIERIYFLHVPSRLYEEVPVPLVLVFHGGGGNGTSLVGFSGFDKVADREGFIAVFPDGVGGNWNDGRENFASESHQLNVDDVGFTDVLIETIASEFPIDRKSIYATGISNGGIFCHFLAGQRSGTLAAIAPVAGGIAVSFNEQFNPDDAVSVLIVQGTEDRLVPYGGGEVAGGNRGEVVSTDETVRLWVEHDGCDATPVEQSLPDKDPNDGCTVTQYTWSNGRSGSEVILLKIVGGGHTWPGGPQYASSLITGRVCRDFDATETIWDFFVRHPKP